MIIPLLTGITLAVMQHNKTVQLGSPCRIVPEQWVFGEYEAATKEVMRLDAAYK